MEEKKEVSALGYSVRAAIGENTEIVFQSFMAADADPAQVNGTLDGIMAIVGRQRALGEVPGLKKERAELERNLAQRTEDKARIDAAHDAKLGELNGEMQSVFDKGYNEHVRSGRQNAYEPKGATAQKLNGLAHDIDKMKNERAEIEKQHEVFVERINIRMAEIDGLLEAAAKLTGD